MEIPRVPQINELSRHLAEADPRRVHIFKRDPYKAPVGGSPIKFVYKKEEDESKIRERRAKIDSFLKRNYEKVMQKKND